jgi:chemotaxis-related protein WspB
MLLLLFQSGNQRFGIDAAEVVEVAPPVVCRKLPHAPAYVAGLANYRGETVPVIDVSALLTGAPAPLLMSTRLVLVRYGGHILGLLAERAVETIGCRESDLQPMPVSVEEGAYLGPVLVDRAGMVQKIAVAGLLPPSVRDMLFPAGEKA